MEHDACDLALAEHIQALCKPNDGDIPESLIQLISQARLGHVCSFVDPMPKEFLDARVIIESEHGTYLQRNWHLETRLIDPLIERLNLPSCMPNHSADVSGLNIEQEQAVFNAMAAPFFILTGGPGTGKTYTARRMIEAHIQNTSQPLKIALAAPTGKALSKLKQSLQDVDGCDFATLHSLLKIKRADDLLKQPPYLPYDLILVDECSMIDMALWGALLTALLPKTKLILLGDVHQLPSIEPGNVFEDLWSVFCKKRPSWVGTLKQSMRTQSEQLLKLADQIHRSDPNFADIKPLPSQDQIVHEIDPVFSSPLDGKISNEKLLAGLEKKQFLSALRQGPYGVELLNSHIYSSIIKQCQIGQQLAIPILLIRNAPDLDLCNGQLGIWVHHIHSETESYTPHVEDSVFFKDRDPLPFSFMPSFELAYVISVHKSQGSEYDDVHLILPPSSERFGRKMLYTAVTRARQTLHIYSEKQTLKECICVSHKRTSGLASRLLKLLQ